MKGIISSGQSPACPCLIKEAKNSDKITPHSNKMVLFGKLRSSASLCSTSFRPSVRDQWKCLSFCFKFQRLRWVVLSTYTPKWDCYIYLPVTFGNFFFFNLTNNFNKDLLDSSCMPFTLNIVLKTLRYKFKKIEVPKSSI